MARILAVSARGQGAPDPQKDRLLQLDHAFRHGPRAAVGRLPRDPHGVNCPTVWNSSSRTRNRVLNFLPIFIFCFRAWANIDRGKRGNRKPDALLRAQRAGGGDAAGGRSD
jgi:hypothetical protein